MTDLNEGLPPAPDADVPAPAPPEPDRTQEILDSARAAVAQAQAQAQAWQQVAQQSQYRPDPYQQQQPLPEPDIEFPDPEVRAAAEKLVDRKLGQMASQMEQAYLRDKQTDMAWRAQVERERAIQKYRSTGWEDIGGAVDQYMSQVPLHLRAHPGAWDEAFKLILGEFTVQQRFRQAQRAPGVAGTNYAPPAPTPAQSTVDPDTLAEVEGILGVKLSAKDIALFGSKKTVTWDEAKGLLED